VAYVTDDQDATSSEAQDPVETGQPAKGDLGDWSSRPVPPVLTEWAARFGRLSENPARAMIENLSRTVSPTFAPVRADVLPAWLLEAQFMRAARIGDVLTPAALRGIQLNSGAALSKVVLSGSAFSGWRFSLATQNMVASWAKTPNFGSRVVISSHFLEEMREVTRINVRLSEVLATLHPAQSVLAARPLGAYHNYVGQLPATPTHRQQVVSRSAGHGINGLLATGVLLEVEPDPDVETLVPLVNHEVVEAWTAGPAAVRAELYQRLGNLESSIPELLEGAWHDVVNPAPARLVTIATCAVEAIDRSLRAAAPDCDVEAWIPTSGRGLADFYAKSGNLTRAARIRFVLRARRGDRRLVEEQATALIVSFTMIGQRLEAAKHASQGDVVAVRCYLLSAEALLAQLFLAL
jgi:hypothetical protein